MPCDPFEMALVHRGFRRELHNAPDLVRGVTAGDRRRAAVVCEHIDFMMTAVHFHHSAEDGVVWPRLSARAPSRAAELTRMEDAHRTIDDACEQVRATAVPWAETGDPRRAEELLPVIEGFAGRVDEHFDDEEQNVVPLIAEYLSPKEWRKFLAHGSAFVRAHPRRGLALGGIVLDGESAQTRERFLGNVPLPVRTVFKMFGDRIYAGYRAQIYGSE
jgi:hemerythrin-like domain-containing protein